MEKIKKFNLLECKENDLVVIYGAAVLGQEIFYELKRKGVINIIFCDLYKSQKVICGTEVLHPSELIKIKEKNIRVILSIIGNSFFDVAKMLKKLNINFYVAEEIISNIDFFKFTDINQKINLINLKYQYTITIKKYDIYNNIIQNRELYFCQDIISNCVESIKNLHNMTLVVTDRCTLRCKECGALVPYFKSPQDIKYNDLLTPFKKFLNSIDYLNSLVIVGGETFLYKELVELVEFCGNHKQIVSLCIPTNATITVDERMLQCLSKYRVEVMISDYNLNREKSINMEKVLVNYGIKVIYRKDDVWNSLGKFDCKNYTEDQLKNVYLTCEGKTCWSMKNGKLFPCGVAAQARELKFIADFKNDYVDFGDEKLTDEKLKKQLDCLIKRDFLEACKYCNGSMIKTKVAEQIE